VRISIRPTDIAVEISSRSSPETILGLKGRSYARVLLKADILKTHTEVGLDAQIASHAPDVLWYAVWTKSRAEKMAATTLESRGIDHYLPLQTELRQWSDRKQPVEVPLFPGYLFVRVNALSKAKLEVLKTPGVAGFVGNATGPLPIPDYQIESVRTAVLCGAECSSQAIMKEGARVRVVRGALAGVEGILLRFGSKSQLVISIDMIQRSVAVKVSDQDVEAIDTELPLSSSSN
jgi:transcription termination/antitermination protein NusG